MANQTYTPSMAIIPDSEVIFQLREEGRLDELVEAENDPDLFYSIMNYMAPRFKLKADKNTNIIRVYHKDGKTARLSRDLSIPIELAEKLLANIPQDRLDAISCLAIANNTNYESVVRAYLSADGDYEAATRLLERKKGFAYESDWEISEKSIENRARLQEREDALNFIEEWSDLDFIAANVFQGTDIKELSHPQETEH